MDHHADLGSSLFSSWSPLSSCGPRSSAHAAFGHPDPHSWHRTTRAEHVVNSPLDFQMGTLILVALSSCAILSPSNPIRWHATTVFSNLGFWKLSTFHLWRRIQISRFK